jgi:hypothetical protein
MIGEGEGKDAGWLVQKDKNLFWNGLLLLHLAWQTPDGQKWWSEGQKSGLSHLSSTSLLIPLSFTSVNDMHRTLPRSSAQLPTLSALGLFQNNFFRGERFLRLLC